jgi:tetratricopeptide (TPR) repeat protein
MTNTTLRRAALLAVLAVSAWAQVSLPPPPGQAAPAQPGQPAAQSAQPAQPGQPSQAELSELQAIASQQLTTVQAADARIKAVDAWVLKYPASPLKAFALSMAAEASQLKGDSINAVRYYNEVLKADPKDYIAMLMIAAETAQRTQEFDLDREEKLGRAEKLVADALALIGPAPKPNPQITDEQWNAMKKDDTARAHEALGMVAMARKKYDDAAKEFQTAITESATPQPATFVRLGGALNEAKKPDEAIKALDQVLAMPGIPQVVKEVAENEKKRSQQLKSGKQ